MIEFEATIYLIKSEGNGRDLNGCAYAISCASACVKVCRSDNIRNASLALPLFSFIFIFRYLFILVVCVCVCVLVVCDRKPSTVVQTEPLQGASIFCVVQCGRILYRNKHDVATAVHRHAVTATSLHVQIVMSSKIIGCKVSSDYIALIIDYPIGSSAAKSELETFISTLPLSAVNQKQSYYTHLLPPRRRPSSQCLGFVILFTR